MNKLKQVFSHDENKSPSGHFTTETSEQVHSHDRNSTGTHNTEGSRLSNDVGTTPHTSSAAGTSTFDNSSSSAPRESLSSSSSTPRESVSSSNTHSSGIAGAAAHLKEHAAPPHHSHHTEKRDAVLSEADAAKATHDHQHLAPVTHEVRHHHEVEEVERVREVDRHVHHVQHHVQPILDTQHAAEVHKEKVVPVTEIKEAHVATDEDKAQFLALNAARDSVVEAPREKVIIDKGEKVVENVAHHVHHIVQPEIERDVHEHHRIHTVIPVHQTTHEAPIVHSSVQHEPMSLADFTAGGGDLSSKLKHDASLLLHKNNTDCERKVDGPLETLTAQLGISDSTKSRPAAYGESYGTSNLPSSANEGRSVGTTSTGAHGANVPSRV